MKQILVVDDEKNMARFIELELEHEGFQVQCAFNGRDALKLALDHSFDLILLDIMLPQLNGVEVCRRIRQEKQTPIIMLTARDSVYDRVSGLDNGADDYIPKPFAIEELLARIRALLRRSQVEDPASNPLNVLMFKDLKVNQEAFLVYKGNKEIELTKREYDLLVLFMQNINRVLTRDLILEKVWGYEVYIETNVVDVYVKYLRNKLDDGKDASYIHTIRGTGYVMRE